MESAKEPLLRDSSQRIKFSDRKNESCSLLNRGSMALTPQLSLNKVIVLLSVYVGLGTVSFFLVRDQIKGQKTNGVLDSVYFCVVTMTTVGYGDLVPNTVLAKLLACVYVFAGMALVGLFLGQAADYVLGKQELLLVRAIHMREKLGQSQLLREAETHKVKYKFFIALAQLVVLVSVGILFLCLFEGLEFMDAFYCVCLTITTTGYGDKSFSTRSGRVFAVFWILGSTICLAQLFLYLAELWTENRRKWLVDWVLTRKFTQHDLEAADLDRDKTVSVAEFVFYKLKEMGKINEEDISLLKETFKRLDIDHSGTLTTSDITSSDS